VNDNVKDDVVSSGLCKNGFTVNSLLVLLMPESIHPYHCPIPTYIDSGSHHLIGLCYDVMCQPMCQSLYMTRVQPLHSPIMWQYVFVPS